MVSPSPVPAGAQSVAFCERERPEPSVPRLMPTGKRATFRSVAQPASEARPPASQRAGPEKILHSLPRAPWAQVPPGCTVSHATQKATVAAAAAGPISTALAFLMMARIPEHVSERVYGFGTRGSPAAHPDGAWGLGLEPGPGELWEGEGGCEGIGDGMGSQRYVHVLLKTWAAEPDSLFLHSPRLSLPGARLSERERAEGRTNGHVTCAAKTGLRDVT